MGVDRVYLSFVDLAQVPGAPDKVAAPFGLERFKEGRMIDESVAAAVAH